MYKQNFKLPTILGEPQGMIKSEVLQEFGYESGATSSRESHCTPHFHIQILEGTIIKLPQWHTETLRKYFSSAPQLASKSIHLELLLNFYTLQTAMQCPLHVTLIIYTLS